MSGTDIIAVIPAFNEELAIGSVVLLTKHVVQKTLVVDDGSADRTGEIATRAGAEVIRLERNQGKAHAIMKGLLRARELDPLAVVMLDADGQHNPLEIPRVLQPILEGRADLVIGSRFLDGANKVPRYRRFGQKTMDYAQNFGSTFKTTDSQSGFRALGRRSLENLDFTSEGYNIESDMIRHFQERGLTITEVPVTARYHLPSHKENPLLHGWSLISHIVGYIGYRRPLLLFGLPGTLFTLAGVVLGFWAFHIYDASLRFPISHSLMSMLLIISGLLLLTAGLILNTLVIIVNSKS